MAAEWNTEIKIDVTGCCGVGKSTLIILMAKAFKEAGFTNIQFDNKYTERHIAEEINSTYLVKPTNQVITIREIMC